MNSLEQLEKTNWQLVVLKLKRAGYTATQIGNATGMNWQHINRLGRGDTHEPRFNSGIKLLQLARAVLADEDFQMLGAAA